MMTTAMCPLRVLLLWALLCPGTGNVPSVQEEIFTRPGSDLLLPIRLNLTLNRTDTKRCDQIEWKYKDTRIFNLKGCTSGKNNNTTFPNMRISENGSLIISNVTLENDGRYSVTIHNSAGGLIQTDNYTVRVEVPVSVPLLHVSCLRNGSAEISCRVEAGTKPNISLSVIGGSQENYSTSANKITAIVGSPGPWNITCTAENGVSQLKASKARDTCPAPLSDIAVNSSCLPDGSAVAECSVKGSDPRYSWSLDGRSVSSSHSRVTLPPPVSGTLRCDVTNQINHLNRSINISCAVPVSDPVLHVNCLQNGSAEISCEVKSGTDPSIYLTVNGELKVNGTGSERGVRVTVPPVSPPDSWNISCSAKNNISEKSTNQTHANCPDQPCFECLKNSLIGGSVALFVTLTPVFIAHWCILRGMKKKS
ncbi:uncharacterized protein LOC120921651 [Rana temporaria]|uniref:uncharacterized protein LOC120921651 n=1 Tax=Rana temporaria TaxID=8407 RepID=UPI001AAC945A|nr:uncharacterized protein LOC120921651 [Rana temporaria]